MYYENEGTCTYMYFLPLKFSQYPSRPVPVPELFGKYPTRPVPKSKTPTRQTLFISYCVKVLKSSVRCAKAMFIDVFVLLAYLWVDNVHDGLINPGLM